MEPLTDWCNATDKRDHCSVVSIRYINQTELQLATLGSPGGPQPVPSGEFTKWTDKYRFTSTRARTSTEHVLTSNWFSKAYPRPEPIDSTADYSPALKIPELHIIKAALPKVNSTRANKGMHYKRADNRVCRIPPTAACPHDSAIR